MALLWRRRVTGGGHSLQRGSSAFSKKAHALSAPPTADLNGSAREKKVRTNPACIMTRLTKQMIQAASGQYDPASVSRLDLSGKGLSDVSCLHECTTLEVLDLSGNSLANLRGIEGLEQLRSLNVAGNAVRGVDELVQLKALAWVSCARVPCRVGVRLTCIVQRRLPARAHTVQQTALSISLAIESHLSTRSSPCQSLQS